MIVTIPLVILMVVVFVFVFLFVKTIDNRKWLTILVSLAITPLVYFYMLYPMINIFTNYHHQKYFSAEIWKEEPSLRYELSDNLITSEILIKKSKNEVTKLLGPPEWLSYNKTTASHDENRWNYGLGIEPGAFNNKKECVELEFKNDLVSHILQYQEPLN